MTRLPPATSFAAVLHRRYTRRGFLSVSGTVAAAAAVSNWNAPAIASARRTPFTPVRPSKADRIELPKGYTHDIIARWGDSLFRGTPSLKPEQIASAHMWSAEAADQQTRQFGTNCDGLGYFPISGERSDRGILCVNHEYVQAELSFAGRKSILEDTPEERKRWVEAHPQAVDVMKAAHGVSVLEVSLQRGRWTFTPGAPLTRRITAETICEICGPARGAPQLRTREDPTGTKVRGTFANCAGGRTPWGTYLTSEENIDDYFALGSLA
ncbi:MAG TPA: alkaline phosphatase PhoX, partial [Steroidobacteraceae bacterium]